MMEMVVQFVFVFVCVCERERESERIWWVGEGRERFDLIVGITFS